MTSEQKQVRPRCPVCQSGNIVVRKDQSIFCRRCGHDSGKPKIED